MIKTLTACVLAGLSISARAQGAALPPQAEEQLQARASEHYASDVRTCEVLRGSYQFQTCLDRAASSRTQVILNGRVQYYTALSAQASRDAYVDTAERCRVSYSPSCTRDLQDAAEQYVEDAVDARVHAPRN